MENKTCPSCGADVPAVATRCKNCFHDFTEEPVKKSNPLLGLLTLVLVLLVIGGASLGYIFYRTAERAVVDEETQSIVFTRKSAMKTETERVAFASVVRVEHVIGGENAMFEVVAVTQDGKRYIIEQSRENPLRGKAEHIAAVLEKPYEEVKNVRGFGE